MAAGFLIGGSTVPVNLIVPYGIAVLPAAIAGIALYGVDHSVLHLLHNAHMVGKAVLGAGTSLVVPIEIRAYPQIISGSIQAAH